MRLIPRNELALYGQQGAVASDNYDQLIARLRPRMTTTDTGVLHAIVLRGSLALGVVAQNRTDSALTDMVIALVVDPTNAPQLPYQAREKLDTFEFFLPRIAPREIVARTGGVAMEGSSITVVTYPADHVVGRRIGGAVSRMPRIARVDVMPHSRREEAGMFVQLLAEAYDTVRREPRDYDDFPAHWTVASPEAHAYLTDTTSRRATVHADREGLAHVSATIGGVTGSSEITFTTDPRSESGPRVFESLRRSLPDDSIQFLNTRSLPHEASSQLDAFLITRAHLCTIYPDGKVRYASWLRPWAARLRADSAIRRITNPARLDSALFLLLRLKECKV